MGVVIEYSQTSLCGELELDPLPYGKSWTPWKCWTVLLNGISESYGLPLQNKLCKKTKNKQQRQSFFQSVGLGPPTAKPDENFLDPCMDIHYRCGRETISLLKTFYSAAKI